MPSGGRRNLKKKGGDEDPDPVPQTETTPEEVAGEPGVENPSEIEPAEGGRRRTRKSGIGKLRPGGLMGYTLSMSKTARHSKLRKVVKSKGALSTFRKLNALATYTKRTAKGKSKVAKTDRNCVKKTYMKK